MTAVHRQRMLEGWEVDVPDNAGTSYGMSWRDKLGENGKLWVFALLVVTACTALGLKYSKQSERNMERFQKMPPAPRAGAISDEMHAQFIRNLQDDKNLGSLLADVRFVGADVLRITLRPSAGLDETDYVAKMAAQRFLRKFNARLVVMSYSRDISGTESLIGTTRWNKTKYGFVTKLRRVEEVPQAT